MPGAFDFLFGRDALKKASGEKDKKSPTSSEPAYSQSDMAKMAQDAADRAKKKKSKGVAAHIGDQMMNLGR